MTMLLGGRAAEQLVFGSITTGASDDLKRVAEIAHAMVHEYAMGTGSSSLRAIDDGAAEATRRVRDAEVRELADEAFRAAHVDHRPPPGPARRARGDAADQRGARARPTSTGSWATSRAPRRSGSASCRSRPRPRSTRRRAPPGRVPRAEPDYPAGGSMLSAIDHVGVAVEYIDAALAHLPRRARDAARPPRDRRRAGRRRRAARRRRRPRRAAPAARSRHRRGQVPGPARPRAAPRRLPRRVGRGHARAHSLRPACA